MLAEGIKDWCDASKVANKRKRNRVYDGAKEEDKQTEKLSDTKVGFKSYKGID